MMSGTPCVEAIREALEERRASRVARGSSRGWRVTKAVRHAIVSAHETIYEREGAHFNRTAFNETGNTKRIERYVTWNGR